MTQARGHSRRPHLTTLLLLALLSGAVGSRCSSSLPAAWTERDTPVNVDFAAEFPRCSVRGVHRPPADGSLTIGDCSVTYQPNAGFVGTDEFVVELGKPRGRSLLVEVPVVVRMPFPLGGCDFGPYQDGAPPPGGDPVPYAEMDERVGIAAAYCDKLRFYSMSEDLRVGMHHAQSLGLDVTATSWVDPSSDGMCTDQEEVDRLIAAGRRGRLEMAVVGNERLAEVGESTLVDCMNRVRRALKASGTPVTTSEEDEDLLLFGGLTDASDVVYPNVHPYNLGYGVENAADYVCQRYEQLAAKYAPKEVVISEVGWRSEGAPKCHAEASDQNSKDFLGDLIACGESCEANGEEGGFEFFYFEAADEPWKGPDDGWGIFDDQWQIKDDLDEVFEAPPDPAGCQGAEFPPGDAEIAITAVPSCTALDYCGDGDFCEEWLEGIVSHVGPGGGTTHDYKVLVYLKVGGTYWLKPWAVDEFTHILPDRSFRAHVCKVPTDAQATDAVALLIDKDYDFDPDDSFTPPPGDDDWLPPDLTARVLARDDVVLDCDS